jgi:biotin carboxylase
MATQGKGGHVITVQFDAQSEKLAKKRGLKMAMPSHKLRNKLDSKIVTTKLGNEAGVASVPNMLGRAKTFKALRELANKAELGDDLVVQTPYGDSGKTTFFISNEADWDKNARLMVDEELKVMKCINPRCGTVEAVATRHGTMVGPILTELVGHKELTPYKGGWSGNEAFTHAVTPEQRTKLIDMVKNFGDRLYREGYRGTFCIDYLIDKKDSELYLGELNPRISGASPITNLITQKYGGVPLLLFHLLECMNIDYDIDVDAIQARWMEFDSWTHVIFRQTSDEVKILHHVPSSGIWQMNPGNEIELVRRTADWSNVSSENEAFFLRILGPGEYLYKGADLGVLLVRGHMQTSNDQLMSRAKLWVTAMKSRFQATGLGTTKHPTLDEDQLLYKIY